MIGSERPDAGGTHWLRIPVGKLHNDRYVPLLLYIVELINDHRTRRGTD